MVELEIVAEPGDVNTAYLEALNNIKTRRPFLGDIKRAQSQAEKEQATKDYYASVRTNVGPYHIECHSYRLTTDFGSGPPFLDFDECQ